MPIGIIGDDGRLQVGIGGDVTLREGDRLVVFGSEKGIEAVAGRMSEGH
jgi:Trk K+ transport system NAD-binding subunit